MSSRVADDKDDEDEEDASVLIISATGLLRTSFSLKNGRRKGNAESRPPAGTNVNALITDIRETTNTHT